MTNWIWLRRKRLRISLTPVPSKLHEAQSGRYRVIFQNIFTPCPKPSSTFVCTLKQPLIFQTKKSIFCLMARSPRIWPILFATSTTFANKPNKVPCSAKVCRWSLQVVQTPVNQVCSMPWQAGKAPSLLILPAPLAMC